MKFLNFDRVLCLSPHPDDVEYSMMGTILKYSDTIFDVVVLSVGGNFDNTTLMSERQSECYEAWGGVNNVVLHTHLYYGDVPGEKKYLEDVVESKLINVIETNYNTQCIVLTSEEDSHFEHRKVAKVANAIARDKKTSIIEYRSPSTLDNWCPNMHIDISLQYEEKVMRLKEFTSQLHRMYFNDDCLNAFHRNYKCFKSGMGLVESFKIKQLFSYD